MKDIGKIGFVLKGDYDNIAEYECLDVVRHNGSVYVSKRTTSGNEPVGDDDNWMLFIDGQNGSSGGSSGSSGTTITIDDFLSMTSENTVQNKVITLALDGKVDKIDGKGLSTNDYTDDEKKKNNDNSIAIQNLEQNYNTTLTTINEINTKVTNVKTYVAGNNITFTENEDGTTTISSTPSTSSSSGSVNINVDTILSDTSENPVQNKVITTKINEIIDSLGTQVIFELNGTDLTITTK